MEKFWKFDKGFYPTPSTVAIKMLSKVKRCPRSILEPSAGKGDLIEEIKNKYRDSSVEISAIEINEDLIPLLYKKDVRVIDKNFLSFSGSDKFDLIIANPPFDEGDKHLLKAIDIMYSGEIVFLLNAETIKNPYSNTRKLLVQKLEELNAEIEFCDCMFNSAERRTDVSVALVYINVEKEIEDELFEGVEDTVQDVSIEKEECTDVSTGINVKELVSEYRLLVDIGTKTILDFYKNSKKIGSYLELRLRHDEKNYFRNCDRLTLEVQGLLNKLLKKIRKDFWRKTLELEEVKNRLTEKRREEFEEKIGKACDLDFTESNIRQFVLNLIGTYEKTLTEAVLEIFDRFTIKHAWDENLHTKNIHYFNGWKTNKAFKVGKKVIIPVSASSCNLPFTSWGGWHLDYLSDRYLTDIDIVMNYFDGMSSFTSISDSIRKAFKEGKTSGIESTYFFITVHKKGTIHLTFKDMDILRRFNVCACKGKNWLPQDYGSKKYEFLCLEEKSVVDSFETKRSYTKNLGKPLFLNKTEPINLLTN